MLRGGWAWQFGRRPAFPGRYLRPCGAPRGVPLPPSAIPGRYLRPCGGAGSVLRGGRAGRGRLNDAAKRPGRGSREAPRFPGRYLRPCGAPRGVPLPPSALPGRYLRPCGGAGWVLRVPLPPSAFPGRYLRPCGGVGVVLRVSLPPSALPGRYLRPCGGAGSVLGACFADASRRGGGIARTLSACHGIPLAERSCWPVSFSEVHGRTASHGSLRISR
jgi:hypothetical protein